jgi:hypothetical protein
MFLGMIRSMSCQVIGYALRAATRSSSRSNLFVFGTALTEIVRRRGFTFETNLRGIMEKLLEHGDVEAISLNFPHGLTPSLGFLFIPPSETE